MQPVTICKPSEDSSRGRGNPAINSECGEHDQAKTFGEAMLQNWRNRRRIRHAELVEWFLRHPSPSDSLDGPRELLNELEDYYAGMFDDYVLATAPLARDFHYPENINAEYGTFLQDDQNRLEQSGRSLVANWHPDWQGEFTRRVERRLAARFTWWMGTIGLKLFEVYSAPDDAKTAMVARIPRKRGRPADPNNSHIADIVRKAGRRLTRQTLLELGAEIDALDEPPQPPLESTWVEEAQKHPARMRRALRHRVAQGDRKSR